MKRLLLLPCLLSAASLLTADPTPTPLTSPTPAPKPPPGSHHVFPPISADDLAKIAAALPTAKVKPLQPRHLLVFYRTEGFTHGSIPYCNEALKEMGEKTGAFTTDFSDEMSAITPDNLKKYDAVLFNNTTQLHFSDPVNRLALIQFVKAGKGFIGIHAAADNFPTWPEAQALLGGKFQSHPWVAHDIEAVKVDNPKDKLTEAFGNHGFWINDEIYQITGPYNRAQVHVLLSLDMSKPENKRDPKKIVRTDNDFPISWVKTVEGGGRVYYCSLGHNPSIYWTPQVLQAYLDGIQFALGDLPADSLPAAPGIAPSLAPDAPAPLNPPAQKTAAPSATPAPTKTALDPVPTTTSLVWAAIGAVTASPPSPADDPLATGLKAISAYDYGSDRGPLVAFDNYIRSQPAADRAKIETALLPMLSDPAVKPGAKDWIARWLILFADAASVPTLQKLTTDPATSHLAVYALFTLNTPAAHAALIKALDTAPVALKPAVIGAIGRAGLADAVPALTKLAADSDVALEAAALRALGDIGTPESLQALEGAKVGPNLTAIRQWAIISGSNHLLTATPGTPSSVAAIEPIVTPLLAFGNSTSLRLAAASLLIRANPPTGWNTLTPLLKDPIPRVRLDAAKWVALLPASSWGAVTQDLPSLDPDVQIVALNAAATAHTPGLESLLTVEQVSKNPDVQVAALRAYGTAGISSGASNLISYLSTPGPLADAALGSLAKIPGSDVTNALRTALANATGPLQANLLNILGERGDSGSKEAAFTAVSASDPAVSAAAFQALSQLVTGDDFPRLLTLISLAKSGESQKSLDRALRAAGHAYKDKDQAANLVITALQKAPPDQSKSLISELASLESPVATAELNKRLQDPSVDARKDVIRVLSTVHQPPAQVLLLQAAKNGTDHAEKVLALRGYLDGIQALMLPDAEKLNDYKSAFGIAERQEEKDAILAAVKNMRGSAPKKLLAELAPEQP